MAIDIGKQEGFLIQCKHKANGGKMGWEAVKDVVGGTSEYMARHPGIKFRRVAVTNGIFNSNAKFKADLDHVALYDRKTLPELISR